MKKILGLLIMIAYVVLQTDCVLAVSDAIMPLGNSITLGYHGSLTDQDYMVSYRQKLYFDLIDRGYDVFFVGSLQAGQLADPAFDYDHEGHAGWTDNEVAIYVYGWLVENPADVVLLHIGTNGLDTSSEDVEGILDEIDRYETDYDSEVTVIMAQIINRQIYSRSTSIFNEALCDLANDRMAAGDKILLVDMEHALDYPNDMDDFLHPTAAGYDKMANVWLSGLEQTISPVYSPLPVEDIDSPVFAPIPQREYQHFLVTPTITMSVTDRGGLSSGTWQIDMQPDNLLFSDYLESTFSQEFTLLESDFLYLDDGPHTLMFHVTDASGNTASRSWPFVKGSIRVNCGGVEYTDGIGNTWLADYGYNTGREASLYNPISGTTDDFLFQTERWDLPDSPELEYDFNVANGDYVVNLYFAEIYSGTAGFGLRVFDVLIEDTLVLNDLDIFNEVGADAALVESFTVTVTDGQLNIRFLHEVQNPKISAIEIIGEAVPGPQPPVADAGLDQTVTDVDGDGFESIELYGAGSTDDGIIVSYEWNEDGALIATGVNPSVTFGIGSHIITLTVTDDDGQTDTDTVLITVNASPAETIIRVNCGGVEYTDGIGNTWLADYRYNTGREASFYNPISGTTDDFLFQTERWDLPDSPELEYDFNVANGDYIVNLYFAEIYSGTAGFGLRVFDVLIEDTLVLNDLDIFSEVGADAALVESFTATVTDGQLNIRFLHEVQNPKISAIEIISQ